MNIRKLDTKSVIIGVLLCFGLVIGIFVFRLTAAHNLNQSDGVAPVFPVNKNGQTYGSDADCNSPDTEPDLIRAIGVDGTEGYVLYKDLIKDQSNTPEDTVAYTKEHAGKYELVPLYASDGITVIGQFEIGGGGVEIENVYENENNAPDKHIKPGA